MSGRGKSFVYFPDEEPVKEQEPVKEEPKSVEILAQALANLTTEFSLVRKENEQLRKELEQFRKEKPKKKVNKPRDYDLFIKNKITELKLIHEGMKYMELRSLANNEWKNLKETMSTASSQNSSA